MAIGDIIVGIDVGTSKVCCTLGQINKFNQVEVLDSASAECDGFKKGNYDSTDSIARAIRFAISDIEERHDYTIKSAYVNILGKYVEVYNTKYGIELKDKYEGVTQKDIDEIISSVALAELPEGFQIIDIVPNKFVTDTKVVADPIGIYTKTLSADLDVIVAEKNIVKTISLAMKKAGLEIDGIIANGLAMKDLVLNGEEEQNGVLLLDVGKGSIDISVFKNGNLLHTDSLPIGGDTIANDIAIVLDISSEEAHKLKKQYGLADTRYIEHDYNIKLSTYAGTIQDRDVIRCSELVEIISARIYEVFEIVKKSLADNDLLKEIKSCVITGTGFNLINKVDKVGEEILGVDVKIVNVKSNNLYKSECVASYGIIKHISNIKHTKNIGSKLEIDNDQSILNSTVKSLKKAFSGAFNKKKK